MKSKKWSSRILSMLLVLTMVLGQVPMVRAADEDVDVIYMLTNITVDPIQDIVRAGESLSVTLSPSEGYTLPDTLEVNGINGAPDYNPATGTLRIDASQITGVIDIVIRGSANAIPSHSITVDPTYKDYITVASSAAEGTTVTVTVSREGYTYGGTIIAKDGDENDVPVSGSGSSFSFTMPASDVEITGEDKWTRNSHALTVADGSKDYLKITAPSPLPEKVDYGTKVEFEAKRVGYAVDTISGADATLGTDGRYSFTMPDEDVELSVTWKQTRFNVNVAAGQKQYFGIGQNDWPDEAPPSCDAGSKFTFRLKIPAGYEYKVTGADATPGTYGSYSFTMPDRDVTLALELTLKDTNFAVYDGANEIKPNKDGWYKASSATVEPVSPATKISLDGTDWSGNVSVAEGRTTVYIQDAAGNEAEGTVKLDGTAPEIEVTFDGIKNRKWIGRVVGTDAKATVTVEDADGSGGGKIWYYKLKESEYRKGKQGIPGWSDYDRSVDPNDSEKAHIAGLSLSWREYNSGIDISIGNNGDGEVVLVKAEDAVGNVAYDRFSFFNQSKGELTIYGDFIGDDPLRILDKNYVMTDTAKAEEHGKIEVKYALSVSDAKDFATNSTHTVKLMVQNEEKGWDEVAKKPDGSEWEGIWEYYEPKNEEVNGTYKSYVVLPDTLDAGNYKISAAINVNGLNYTKELNFTVKREMPQVTTMFSGAGGYENDTGFTKIENIDGTSGTLAENFTLYYNGGQDLVIHPQFGLKDTHEAISSVSYAVNGTEIKKINNFFGYDYKPGDFTITGLNEGENTIEFTIVAFDGFEGKDRDNFKKTVTVTVIVDKTAPIVAPIYVENTTQTPRDDDWFNSDLNLTIGQINDTNLITTVNVSKNGTGSTAELTLTDDVYSWLEKVSGDQNTEYIVTVTDKAGNTATQTAYVNIDTTTPDTDHATVFAKSESSDKQIAADVATFGIFHQDYSVVSLDVKDSKEGAGGSGIKTVEYVILENNDTYTSEAAATTAAEDATWATAKLNDKQYQTESLKSYSDSKYTIVFKVTDVAGNSAYVVRSVLIDNAKPTITFTAETPVKEDALIFNAIPKITVNISDGDDDNTYYSGLKEVEFKIWNVEERKEDNFIASGNKTWNSQVNDGTLEHQGQKTLTFTLENDGGQFTCSDKEFEDYTPIAAAHLESRFVFIEIIARDWAGNESTYESGYINIDTAAPKVKVVFDPYNTNTYYAQPRTATITIVDQNVDPITMVKYQEDESGKKLNSAYTITTKEPGAEDTDVTVIKGNDKDPGSTDGTKCVWTYTVDDKGLATYTQTIRFDEGKHSFSIDSVTDAAGNEIVFDENADPEAIKAGTVIVLENGDDHNKFIVDMTDPSLTIHFVRDDNKAFDEYNNSNVTLMINSQDTNGANVSVKVNGTISGMRHFTEDGVYEIVVTATDPAGNFTEEKETFTIDQTDPEIVFSGVEDQSAYKDEEVLPVVEVTDKNYEPADVELELVGSNGGSASYDATDIASGERFVYENIEEDDLYTLTVKVTDKAENTVEKKITFSVNRNGSVFTGSEEMEKAMEAGIPYFRDETLPEIAVYETNVDLITTAKLYLAKDNGNIDLVEGVDYIVERETVNGGWNRYKYIVNKDKIRSDGVYRISLVTEDRAGNAKNAESVVAFVLDNTDPLVQFINIEAGKTYNEEMRHVVFTPQDNLLLSKVQVFVDDEEVATWEGEELEKLLRGEGEFAFDLEESRKARNIKIVLIDAAGNENEEQEINRVTVSTNLFIRIYNNKPLFYGLLAALIGGGGFMWWWFFIFKRRKDDEEENK